MAERRVREIAAEIMADWETIGRSPAKEYVDEMLTFDSLDAKVGAVKGVEIVSSFLGVCGTWRGPVARRIKAELRSMLSDWDKANPLLKR
jgi:hypothetical protein